MGKQPTIANEAIPEEERQPTRRGVSERTRTYDQTFLDPQAEIVHRDYAAHFFRWGFAKDNFIVKDKSVVLDVGCGPDRPLMLALFGGIGANFPKKYVGVDLNKVKPTRHQRTVLYPETNIFEEWDNIVYAHGPFDLVTNFEVIEHMPKSQGQELLHIFRECLRGERSRVLMSTPVYDGKGRARNHIHEYTIPELQEMVEEAGLQTYARYGTFMNVNQVRKVASDCEMMVFNRLKEYYSNDVLSTFLAPLHPDQSRNNIWVLGLETDDEEDE